MPSIKLTKRFLDGLEPVDQRVIYFDSDITGFGLAVTPAGTKTWILEYRAGAGGRRAAKRRMTLGKASALTPEQARALAKEQLARIYAGEDPAAEKQEARTAKTVADLCDLYLAEAEQGNVISRRGVPKKASTLATDRGRIARHVKPLLGSKLVRDVMRTDIERFLRDVAAGKTAVDVKTKKRGRAIVTGGRGTATRTVRLLGGIFSYAVRLGLRADNPTHGVAKYADRQGARFLSSAELARLGDALRTAETDGLPWDADPEAPGAKHLPKRAEDRRTTISPYAAAAIRLLILTGCRLREILHLEWAHFDSERGLLHLPDSKTGAKTIVLARPALDVLANIPRLESSRFVIPGSTPDKPRSDLKGPWALVTRAAGLPGVRLHDLRHTYASQGAAAGMGLTIVGRLLGHADVKTTNRYSHFDADPLRLAADGIGGALLAAMAGKAPKSRRTDDGDAHGGKGANLAADLRASLPAPGGGLGFEDIRRVDHSEPVASEEHEAEEMARERAESTPGSVPLGDMLQSEDDSASTAPTMGEELIGVDILDEVVPPHGPGWMKLYHAALWIATRGGKVRIDPSQDSSWKSAYDDLIAQIADGNVRVVGMRNGEREAVPAFQFAGIRVTYPSGNDEDGLWFEDEVHLCSYRYIDERRWLAGSDDSLFAARDEHGSLEKPLEALRTPRWRRLLVNRSDVRRLWGFEADPSASDVPVSSSGGQVDTPAHRGAQESGESRGHFYGPVQASGPLPPRRHGRPSLKALVVEEFMRRREAGKLAATLAGESRILSAWLTATLPEELRAKPKTVEAHLRQLWPTASNK